MLSIVCAELANACIIVRDVYVRKKSVLSGLVAGLGAPVAPALCNYLERRTKFRALQVAKSETSYEGAKLKTEASGFLCYLTAKEHDLRGMRAALRSNENAFEHFAQLCLLLLVLLAEVRYHRQPDLIKF